ncbi:MAG TPA: aminotransferase class V-fold PLP-dependent enzyme [Acidiferrobacteraceae bacterium]|nr:aminotransferase class V-fold PLP-dependent enzyme [Acidiferrobacteraceae bacterium]
MTGSIPQSPLDALIEREFGQQEVAYFNHAAVGPWARRTAVAVQSFADESARLGATRYPQWLEVEAELRARAARLVHAAPSEIAFLKNTSEGLSVVAHGFPWHPGDRIVVPAEEFPSNRIVWESLASQGVRVHAVSLTDVPDPEDALLQALDRNTRLLSVSSVQYARGLRLDLERLGKHCHTHGIAFCVDAIQGLGCVAHDVARCRVDFLVADAHKWLLGPEGIALFYCSEAWRDRLTLRQFGWRMTAQPERFDAPDWTPAASSRRFECGSPNMLGIHALDASLSLFEEIGIAEIATRLGARVAWLMAVLAQLPGRVLTPDAPERRAGIVSWQPQRNPADLYAALLGERCVCAVRAGALRFSPHFYTPWADLERLCALLRTLA